MTRAFLGLGSNLGDRSAQLCAAIEALKAHGLRAVSSVYETEPVGGPQQGPYLNLVTELDTELEPHHLLSVCKSLEAAVGRVREIRWGPRRLDVDVLWMDGVTLDDSDLQIPHPRMWERRFVLAPLRELAPDLVGAKVLAGATGRVERWGVLRCN